MNLLPLYCLAILLSIVSNCVTAGSQQPPLALDKYFYQTWDTSDGLPHNAISDLSQSNDGYLWMATWEGLVRFNGQIFMTFERGSKVGLPDSAVKSLFSTSDGRLLVAGARGGLSERENGFWRSLAQAETIINHAIYDNKQGIWLGMEQGLAYRAPGTQSDVAVISNVRVYQIVEDENDDIWAATSKGLYRVQNKNKVTHFPLHDDKNDDLVVFSVVLDRDNNILIGTANGAFKMVGQDFVTLNPQLKGSSVFKLFLDSNNDLWIGTIKKGLFRLSDLGIEQLNENSGLPNNRILAIFEDQENSIWIGTAGGLFRLREAPFVTLTTKQGLVGNYIRTVLSHSDGSMWVGSSKGLNHIKDGKVSTILSPEKHSTISVLSLAEGTDQQVYIGSYAQGVFRVIDGELESYQELNLHLSSYEIRSLLIDSKDNIWVGTTDGVVVMTPSGEIKRFNLHNGLPANFIMALAEDRFGKIWIGTGNGVVTYSDGALVIYHLKSKFDAEYAFGFQTTNDAMWLATDRGILRVDLKTDEIKSIGRDNGLPIDKFFQIIIDRKNIFWLTSNRGIVKINGDEITKAITNKNEIIKYELFTEESGLVSSQANGGSTPAATLAKDGSIWIATAHGVTQVSHDRLFKRSKQSLPVVIEQLIVDGVKFEFPISERITLPAGTAHIAIYYAGLGFLNSEQIQYQTRLIGFDLDWQDKDSQIYTEYTNLAPGYYRFMMRAKYPDGKWQSDLATVGFTIEPYFWQTLWFRINGTLLIIILLYLGYRYRLIKIKNNEKRLEQLVEKQTLELKDQAQLFAYQATHDQLTGLPNRRAFDSWCDHDFKQAASDGQNLSLAVMDIDFFKRVNDGYSHMVGDVVIKVVANILRQQLVTCKSVVKLARWGGEEFTLLVKSDKDQAFVLCELIRKEVEKFDFSDIAPGLNVTISCGLTDNNTAPNYDNMITLADHALYYAKHNGRNMVKIYSDDVSVERTINEVKDCNSRRKSD